MKGARRILVVEDNAISRQLLRMTLELRGYVVEEAPDGETGLAMARANLPELVLLDLGLGDMDGIVFLGRLRALFGGSAVPVIAVSGYVERLERLRSAGAGFVDILVKPVDPIQVQQVVEAHLPRSDVRFVPGQGKRVLVVDDDPVQRQLLSRHLQQLGFTVGPCSSGEEALVEARRTPPDAILVDALMPPPDGFRLCLLVRQDPALSRVPVLLLSTAYTDPADQRLAVSVGASALVIRGTGTDSVIEPLLAVLKEGRAPAPRGSSEEIEEEYRARVLHQLERQSSLSQSLARRCALQAAELAVLGGISERIAHHTAPDLALVLEQCLDAGGISAGAIYGVEGGRLEGHARKGFSDDAAEALGRWLATNLEWVFARDVPSLIDGDVPGGRDLCKRAGSELLVTPLTSRGERLGVLVLASRAREPGGEEWLSFVHTVATQIGLALALTRTFTRLGESEAQFRQLAETLHEVAWTKVPGVPGLWVSPAYERVWGHSLAELTQDPRAWLKAVHPEDQAVAQRAISDSDRQEVDVLYRIIRPDGSIRWIRDRCSHLRDATGAVIRVVGLAEDVTELKQAAELADRAARLSAFNAAVGMALAECEDLPAALRCCAQAAIDHLGAAFCRIWLLEDDDELTLRASAGLYTHLDGGHARVKVGALKIGRIAARREPYLTNDVPHDPQVGDQAWAAREGLRSFAGYPLLVEGRLVGVMAMFARTELDDMTLDALGSAARVIAVGLRRKLDEAARDSLEAQLRQAQKMEAVGRLAGGVAHDFNNLLTAIMGYSELMLARLRPEDPFHKEVEEIRKAGNRAAGLTRQLLVFSRHQVLQLKVLDLNAIVADMEKMLRRLIGEDVELVVRPTRPLGRIKADAGQVEQVILNLCVNARDAMPRGGRLAIETSDVRLSASDHVRGQVLEGEHVRLRVTDSGTGMTPEVQAHLFEPFFTTKEEGKGTGLGLSTVWGIVRGAGGGVLVRSEPGKGSSFEVYFPRVYAEEPAARPQTPSRPLERGVETVLLVEDDELVRDLAASVLEMGGYRLIVAESGPAALLASDRHTGPLDLVLTDVVMPGMSGKELAEELLRRRPGLKVLYFSGYTSGVVLQEDVLGTGSPFIGKPFTPTALLRKVREVLDAGRR